MKTLPDRLARTIRLAATAPPKDPAALIAAAAADGAWAARHGRRLPLFVFLDARAMLPRFERRLGIALPDSGRTAAPPTRAYEDWLRNFCAGAVRRTHHGLLADPTPGDPSGATGSGYVPLLVAQWPTGRTALNPDTAVGCSDWADAFGALRREPALTAAAAEHWSAARDVRGSKWAKWWPPAEAEKRKPANSEPAKLDRAQVAAATWARFAVDRPELSLYEQCDHAAAALYFETNDPELTQEQAARLRLLRLVLAESQRPTLDSWEEQHPHVGAGTLFTLTLGPYGDFMRVNNSDPKISAPPRARQPNKFGIHLCWLLGYAAARATVPEPRDPTRSTTAGSVFQGALALLLDDWRAALTGIQARFHLYRAAPRPDDPAAPIVQDRINDLRPGVRWKTELLRDNGPMPPPHVIGYLFRRHALAELAAWKPAFWVPGSGTRTNWWWCGFAARDDMTAIGFREIEVAGSPVPAWTGPPGLAPAPLRTVLVIDPRQADGWVYHIVRDADRTLLQPVARSRYSTDPVDGSFPAFRRAALDALLDAVLNARQ